jgi:hypothetical protein
MAIKNIVKFLLKMAIAGAVLAGIIFLVIHFTSSKSSTDIVDKSYKNEIVAKYEASFDGLNEYAEPNSVKARLLGATNQINKVLVEYYNHYITLTGFEKKSSAKKEIILNKMDTLLGQIAQTTNLLNLTKSQAIQNNEAEKTQRFNNTLDAYVKQTKTLFEIDDLLQEYVFETNYQSTYSGITYDTQLEMMKDFSKYVFDTDIYGQLDRSYVGQSISYAGENGFAKVVTKFLNRQKVEVNGDKETKFVDRYFNITNEYLNNYYSKTNDAMDYISSVDDATMRNNLDALYKYLIQSAY